MEPPTEAAVEVRMEADMASPLLRADQIVANTRPGWLWLGQFALIALGVHLAADRVDDLSLWLVSATLGPSAAGPRSESVALGLALGFELLVTARVAWVLAISAGGPAPSRADWWRRRSVEAFTRPVFWAVMGLAGAYTVAMAVQDAVAPTLGGAALWLGVSIGALAAWRLGLSGWLKVTG